MGRVTLRISEFMQLESAGGILLMGTAALAMILANTPLYVFFDLFIATPVHIKIGPLEIAKPLLLWVNDGLMATFFFLVGLELKRELLIGELSDKSKITLPALGAIGGMAIPALIFIVINIGDPEALRGWAIPAATDIAFALGFIWLGIKLKISTMPEGLSWGSLYGMSALCGIGFTMSLFIGSLAFDQTVMQLVFDERLGVVIGSMASGIFGVVILHKTLPKTNS